MSPLTGKATQGVHNARQEDYDLRRKVLLNKKEGTEKVLIEV